MAELLEGDVVTTADPGPVVVVLVPGEVSVVVPGAEVVPMLAGAVADGAAVRAAGAADLTDEEREAGELLEVELMEAITGAETLTRRPRFKGT